jgi:flagellar basal body-associated protein FliL
VDLPLINQKPKEGKMKNKKLLLLSILATSLACSMLVSGATAQETSRSPALDISTPPDAVPLIAPTPDENTTTVDDDQIYYTLDQNITAPTDTQSPGSEDGNLIAPQLVDASATDNNLAVVAIGVLSVVIGCGAVGVVYYHRSSSKRQL